MSIFQNVWLELECEHCHKLRETNVRFHGSVTLFEDFYINQEIEIDCELAVGELFEGNVDLYCRDCLFKWCQENANAAYEALIHCLKIHNTIVKEKLSSRVLCEEKIRDYKNKYINSMAQNNQRVVTMPYFEEFDIIFRNKPVRKNEDLDIYLWEELTSIICPLMEEKLKELGWKAGLQIDRSCYVTIDPKTRIILVQDLTGISIV